MLLVPNDESHKSSGPNFLDFLQATLGVRAHPSFFGACISYSDVDRIQQLSGMSQSSRPSSSRNQIQVPAFSNLVEGESPFGLSPPPSSSCNAIRPKTSNSIRSNRSPTFTCSKGTYVPGSLPSKCVLPFKSASMYHPALINIVSQKTAQQQHF
jgi:hypothetical protein